MNISKVHKTFSVCIFFIAGIMALGLGCVWQFAILPIVAICYLIYKKIFSVKFAVFCLAIFLVGVGYLAFRSPVPDDFSKFTGRKVFIMARVLSNPDVKQNYRGSLEIEVQKVYENKKVVKTYGKAILNVYDNSGRQRFRDLQLGDRIVFSSNVKIPREATNPGQFDYKKYLENQRIFTVLNTSYDSLKIKPPNDFYWSFMQKINNLRSRSLRLHERVLDYPESDILGGIVFGSAAVPTPLEEKTDFINSGLYHLLAASGMNVGLIFGMWFFFASKLLKLPYRPSIAVGMFLVLVYMLMTAFPPSVMRAGLMVEFILIGKLIEREANNTILLVIVGTLLLLYEPLLIYDIGFQLSFIVTLGLLFCMPVLMEKTKTIPSYISASIIAPFVAQIWAAPVQVYHFNTFATYSLFANVLATPIFCVISTGGFIGSLFSFFPFIGERVCYIGDMITAPFLSLLINTSKYFSSLPSAVRYFGVPSTVSIFLFYLFIFVIIACIKTDFKNKKFNIIAVSVFLTLFVSIIYPYFSRDLRIVYFDSGQSDAIFIQTPTQKNIVIDTGLPGKYNAAKLAMVPYLRDKGVNQIDAIILTHPDIDHTGGTADLIRNFEVKKIYTNGMRNTAKPYRQLERVIEKKNIKTFCILKTRNLQIDKNLTIKAIRVKPRDIDDTNENSIILYLKYKDFSGLFMGDSELDSLEGLKTAIQEPVDVLKVGHHGSYQSLSDDFLKFAKPQFAVISVGRKNEYGHPNRETLDLLRKYHIKTCRTDRDMAVETVTDGEKIGILKFLDAKNRY